MRIPRPIEKLIESFERLPGIGPKTAQRLTFHLLRFPQAEIQKFADSLVELKSGIKLCSICKNVSENEICSVCDDPTRNQNIIIVVSGPLDVFAIEKTGFKGVYHVLHGVIDPLNNVGPEELFLEELKTRAEKLASQNMPELPEIVLATNTGMEGEATSLYIVKMLRDAGLSTDKLKITRIARGMPVGGDIEYADDITLSRALEGRSLY
jgi:recombination protein RecR